MSRAVSLSIARANEKCDSEYITHRLRMVRTWHCVENLRPLPTHLGQPFCSLSSDQPACQFEYPASQSYGLDDVSAQPMCLLEQHQPFLSADHPASQFEYPAAQSYGSDGLDAA